jgi:hypothetical protein
VQEYGTYDAYGHQIPPKPYLYETELFIFSKGNIHHVMQFSKEKM